jgi:hypothetical protein
LSKFQFLLGSETSHKRKKEKEKDDNGNRQNYYVESGVISISESTVEPREWHVKKLRMKWK